ncbi:MAG: hypothetical protein NVS1B4_17060 [Gemmatimonadaceae bacterium]
MTKRKSPQNIYREEKQRVKKTGRPRSHELLMADAKRAYEALLAAGEASRKRGRPKRSAVKPVEADVDESDLGD